MQCELTVQDVQERYKHWTENEYFDLETRRELLGITDPKEIEDRFYTDLEFGTGGMRGLLGAGTNRMNKYLIRRLSQGLADTIKDYGTQACDRGVVIAYDSRRYSPEFALETALVLAGNGIKAYLFDSLRPTPELSFAVRYLKAMAGVNITASHNPKDYNGYKVYWEDGGQVPPDKAAEIVAKITAQQGWEVKLCAEDQARAHGLLVTVGAEVDQAYYSEIVKGMLYPELTAQRGKNIKIVYTPLHGTGNRPVCNVLTAMGFTCPFIVAEQEEPNAEFPTVKSPNPEDPEAFSMALELGAQEDADIILATDPDADRLGLYSKDDKGQYVRFTGNQIGVILAYYLLSQKQRLGILPANAVLVKTVASTDLGDAVAGLFGVRTINVLVGFKFIGEQIKEMEETGSGTFELGFEESHGYLAGTYARDKDAVQAAALLAEAALYYQEMEHKTLGMVLKDIHEQCGYYKDEQVALTLHGLEGRQRICAIMSRLREAAIAQIAGVRVRSIEDYEIRKRIYVNAALPEEQIDLPSSDILRFSFDGGGFIVARPSGTEPKIRFYFCIKSQDETELMTRMDAVKKEFFAFIEDLIN